MHQKNRCHKIVQVVKDSRFLMRIIHGCELFLSKMSSVQLLRSNRISWMVIIIYELFEKIKPQINSDSQCQSLLDRVFSLKFEEDNSSTALCPKGVGPKICISHLCVDV